MLANVGKHVGKDIPKISNINLIKIKAQSNHYFCGNIVKPAWCVGENVLYFWIFFLEDELDVALRYFNQIICCAVILWGAVGKLRCQPQ